MFRFLVFVLAFLAFFVCRSCPAQTINFDPVCAFQAVQTFSECRQGGGRLFGCLAQSGADYWVCSGSSLTSSSGLRRSPGRVRLAVLGRRVNRFMSVR